MNGVPGRRRDPLDQPHRGLGGDGRVPGRHRRLVRAPDGQRAAQAGRERHPARLRPPRAGAGVDGAGRDLRVLSGVEEAHADGAAHAARLGGGATSCARSRASSRSTAWAARPSSTRWCSIPSAWPATACRSATCTSILEQQQRRDRRRLHREEPRVVRHPRRRAVPQHRGHREHRRHLGRRRHAGADQAPGRRCGSARRCASARSPSTARARSSPAR